ncbi:MAG: alpha/beta hydrolase [Flavobacteriales bacterium CG_4_9_14_3_um_filter_40_17]|nr:MAG: alpha/beta hydrolase [Flavobacteriales bacterium CG_4_9_14_3_um_filter_40_17]
MPQNDLKLLQERSVQIPPNIIKTGKILQSLSLSLATKFAAKLFITPIKYTPPKREEIMDRKSVQKDFLVKEINRIIRVYEYGQSDKKILLVHGWSGRGTQMFKIADALLKLGYMTISFDAPAHGKSPGKTTMMPHFIATCLELGLYYGGFYAAVGHSLGGMSLLNVVRKGLHLDKLVLIGTGDSITEISYEFVKNLQLKPEVATKMKKHFDKLHGEDIDRYSGSEAAAFVHIPVLVIHDEDDRDVALQCALDIDKNLKNSELFITQKLGHRMILGNREVIEKICNFVEN